MAHLDIGSGVIVANAKESERVGFIRNTYLHLGGAILAFILVETLVIQSGLALALTNMIRSMPMSWLIIIGLFMGASYFADKWARSPMSREMQYVGLGLFIVAEAIVFSPMILMALNFAPNPNALPAAALLTLMLAGGLTFTAFSTKKDFSFLRPAITIGTFVALGMIVASMIFGFSLGLFFAAAMIILAAASMLYQTSEVIHNYHTDQHVAASLGLFSSVGLMFYYMLMLIMSFTGGD
ncbi:MAG: Permease [uncultured Thiotrichaceae bacterium]|uniref:Permease n=1 Tax=uncultured Thiotrichaceae bacterium TaxID=298394 RepID=A0A6S6SA86_9GAMM|nr:MAG: Permease [uncultured Thiotrichaceae bacterium]